MTKKLDPEAGAAEIARFQEEAVAEVSRAEHWRKIALADRQAENERRQGLGMPPLPIPDELKRGAP